ncbi:YitT family protein [Jiulongibacter sediminis]|uniref:YitT family protein n=1 Tax=Jiulongibacter sediminis TaxID=1605367 RepID=UPI000BAA2AC4|nr:YitT family protein [Jiulongibacter sediminis]TBX23423.1 membrane protein [Jiulongibacter sediminis]
MSSSSFSWSSVFSFKSVIFTVLGALCATVAIKGFMIPNHFLDGGITGISILLHEIFHVDVSIPLVLINLPFIYLGYRKIGKGFAVQSLLAVLLLAVFLQFLSLPTVTNDKILIAVFGGFFIGLGIGFIIRAGGVIDGLEVIAEYTTNKTGLSSSEIIMAINTLIFLAAAYSFGLEKALYSILTYFTATQVSGYVVDGFEQYTALTVISGKSEEVKDLIVNEHGKAISVYKGERGYLPESFDVHEDCDILMTIVTRLEIQKIRKSIFETDPAAFVYINSIKDVSGGQVKKIRNH